MPSRRLAVPFLALILAFGGAAAWISQVGAAPTPQATAAPPGIQPNGVNFSIHSSIDPNFCVEATASATVPASEVTMSQCAARDNQHWTFANDHTGSVVIIGGNGDCLDFTGKTGSYTSLTPCTFAGAERFYYSPDGLIESTSGKKCLEPAQVTQNATISIVKCAATVKAQIWQLSH